MRPVEQETEIWEGGVRFCAAHAGLAALPVWAHFSIQLCTLPCAADSLVLSKLLCTSHPHAPPTPSTGSHTIQIVLANELATVLTHFYRFGLPLSVCGCQYAGGLGVAQPSGATLCCWRAGCWCFHGASTVQVCMCCVESCCVPYPIGLSVVCAVACAARPCCFHTGSYRC